jgi:hypothetical protein
MTARRILSLTGSMSMWRASLMVLITGAVAAAWITGCNEPFDPRSPLDQQLVVYSILSNDRDVQFVRVNSNYMPSGFDPNSYSGDNSVRDALVTISSSGGTLMLRDTTMARPDSTRYDYPLYMYAITPFTPVRGRAYQVFVQSPSLGTASGSTVVPGVASIKLADVSVPVLSDPLKLGKTEVAEYNVVFSSAARAYSTHLYIYYDVLKGSKWVEERTEVPYSSSIWDTTYSLQWAQYADLVVCPDSGKVSVDYANGFLKNIITDIQSREYPDTHVIFKWIVFVVLQADQNLFGYYQSVRGYRDPHSIRLDQPQYSKIDGGVGVIGAYAVDTLVFVVSGTFSGNQ